MPVPVVELITFTPSAAYVATPDASLQDFFGILAQTNGHIESYHGLQVENLRQGHIVILWETHQHHVSLQQSSHYQALREALLVAVEGPRQMVHVLVQHDCSRVFKAPHVGIATNTVKDAKNIGLLKHHLDTLVSQSYDEHVVSHTCGRVLEDEKKIVLFAGWKSHEHRESLRQNRPAELEKLIGNINDLADVEVRHVRFKKYSGVNSA
ncbi:hypothetical protein K503DRAFT_858341 [Rhizopogon vinicolor AM-OR11-026]|uniref:ABM domain-containing protein n=1 Tax=Rhizopogon vinicolor AM-OR11-026 TaxID=1314800 RepID=A0A1B7MTE2_9AGAM|nr:hypothetical protein K503DRAFT_858341 [Rhizopogon vinicolor AM-OR11-026]